MKVHEIQSDLWLTKIDYSGDNIGNEFEFDISRGSSDKSIVKIRLQNGQTNTIDKLLFTMFFNKEQSIMVNVTASEKDDYPDKGIGKASIAVKNKKVTSAFIEIDIEEINPKQNQNLVGKLKIYFELRSYKIGIQMLYHVDDEGWIAGKYVDENGETFGSNVYFPKGLKVNIYKKLFYDKSRDGYIGEEFFEILEGNWLMEHKLGTARLLIPEDIKTRFSEKLNYKDACKLTFRIKTLEDDGFLHGKLKIEGIAGELNALTSYDEDTLPNGIFPIEIPDTIHKNGKYYLKNSIYARTWFRVKFALNSNQEFYLHFGQLSSGCITVLQDNPEHIWSKVYERLIYCRKKGQKGIVGTVEVVHEER